MDVCYRKLCRQIIEVPPATNWSLDWHEIQHVSNEGVEHFGARAGVKSWPQSVCTKYWKFARYVACVPSHRWVKRVLAWTPPGSRNSGRPANSRDQKIIFFQKGTLGALGFCIFCVFMFFPFFISTFPYVQKVKENQKETKKTIL